MVKKKKIIAITTDSYNDIKGFTLVFMKLFDFIQKNNHNLDIVLISNNGICSKIIENKQFKKIKLNPKSTLLVKTFLLSFCFIKNILFCDKDTVIVANGEIPELLTLVILKKFKFKNAYCVIQDLRIRNDSFKLRLINKLRLFLIYKIKNIIFTNKYTMNQLNSSVNKFYIGNPII
jgi:hypothetical protein